MRSTPATRSGARCPEARSAQTTDMPSATMRSPARQACASSGIAPHHAQVRGVGRDDRMGGARCAAQFDAPGHRAVHGQGVERQAHQFGAVFAHRPMQPWESGARGARARGGTARASTLAVARPFSDAQACVLVGAEEAPELEVVIARQAA